MTNHSPLIGSGSYLQPCASFTRLAFGLWKEKGGSMLYLLYLAIFAHGGQRRGKHIIHTCTGGSLQVQSLEFEFNDM